jgi:hypothetical protein
MDDHGWPGYTGEIPTQIEVTAYEIVAPAHKRYRQCRQNRKRVHSELGTLRTQGGVDDISDWQLTQDFVDNIDSHVWQRVFSKFSYYNSLSEPVKVASIKGEATQGRQRQSGTIETSGQRKPFSNNRDRHGAPHLVSQVHQRSIQMPMRRASQKASAFFAISRPSRLGVSFESGVDSAKAQARAIQADCAAILGVEPRNTIRT